MVSAVYQTSPRIPQLQFAQPHLNSIADVAGNHPIIGKQAHRCVLLPVLIKHRQALSPRCFLLIVDLAQIQNCSLRGLARR